MSNPETYDELLKHMYGNRKELVNALHFYNGEANTQELRNRGDIPRGSIYDLITKLSDWNVIEQVGQEPVGRGGPADVYQFTDLGRAISQEVVESGSTTVDDVETLEEELQAHREMLQEHSEALDELKAKYDEDVEKLIETVQGYIDNERTESSA